MPNNAYTAFEKICAYAALYLGVPMCHWIVMEAYYGTSNRFMNSVLFILCMLLGAAMLSRIMMDVISRFDLRVSSISLMHVTSVVFLTIALAAIFVGSVPMATFYTLSAVFNWLYLALCYRMKALEQGRPAATSVKTG